MATIVVAVAVVQAIDDCTVDAKCTVAVGRMVDIVVVVVTADDADADSYGGDGEVVAAVDIVVVARDETNVVDANVSIRRTNDAKSLEMRSRFVHHGLTETVADLFGGPVS